MDHVFISYVRENFEEADRLADGLRGFGVRVWIDREEIAPGEHWPWAIRRAIGNGSGFVACFSSESQTRSKSGMNEELSIAIEELRKRSTSIKWFVPVKLSECEIPDIPIGFGETLRSIEYVKLFEGWDEGVRRIAEAIAPVSTKMRDLLPTMVNRTVPSFNGSTEYLVEEVDIASHVTLSGSGRQARSVLPWSEIERVFSCKDCDELTPTLVDEILDDFKNLDSSPMCALVLAMWDPTRLST